MAESSRELFTGNSKSSFRLAREKRVYLVSAAGGNITRIEIVPRALSRREYVDRGRSLMSMLSLHKI